MQKSGLKIIRIHSWMMLSNPDLQKVSQLISCFEDIQNQRTNHTEEAARHCGRSDGAKNNQSQQSPSIAACASLEYWTVRSRSHDMRSSMSSTSRGR